MPVSDTHPEYDKYLPQWNTVNDCIEGSATIKKAKKKYLPKPNPDDTSDENDNRYLDYIERANFVGFTSSTQDGMLGMVYRKPMETELQKSIEYLNDDIDGGGITLDQMSRSLVSKVLANGRFGLLVDYPEAAEGQTKAQTDGLRANILPYSSESIINWRTEMVGSVRLLTMVVLAEKKAEPTPDGFSLIEKDQYRVLRLVDGFYVQEIYDDKSQIVSATEPKNSKGGRWTEIPFVFVGAKNNDERVDKAPLYDIATVNIAHYRNSADYEESCYMVGQPTPYIAGLSQGWVDTVMKSGVILGSRDAWLLPENGSAGLLQANPNQMPEKGMINKEDQMVKIGARIIQQANANEVVDAVKMRYAGQTSKLGIIVGNVESALLQCFDWAMAFMGGEGDNLIEINKDFYDKTIDPQLVIAQIQLLDRAVIAKSDLQDDLRAGGMIKQERTNEEIDDEAEVSNVMV